MPNRGFFGIGIEHGKTPANIGTLWRSAFLLGAAYIFTVRSRYERQSSDTVKAWRHLPMFHFDALDDLVESLPRSTPLVGIELDVHAHKIENFVHPERACYLLGAEDHGLTRDALDRCHMLVQLPGTWSMNVAVAGSVVMYDRHAKEQT